MWIQPIAQTSPRYPTLASIETIYVGLILILRMRAQVYQKEVQEEDGVTEEAPVPRKMCEYVYEG